jgi:hypothetical protein
VSVERQRVDSIDGEGGHLPLRSCAVTSRTNWHCRSADDSSELGFSDGQAWLRVNGAEAVDLEFLPRWRYLWLKRGETHRPDLRFRR